MKHGRIPAELTQVAAEVFVFDTIIINADRRPLNPNCLTNGEAIAIFDHELSFGTELFWKAPWLENGFDRIASDGNHIFSPTFFVQRPTQLDRFKEAWKKLPAGRFQEYCGALPGEWLTDNDFLNRTVSYLIDIQGKIDLVVDRGLEKLK